MPTEQVIDVVVRCRDEMPYTTRCLDALARQAPVAARVLFLDCGSTDGSREAAEARGLRIGDVDPTRYIPGAVLNRGMAATRSPVVAFVNADAIARSDGALAELIAPLVADEGLACVYARQVAREGAAAATAADYARAFPEDGPPRLRRGVFFSAAVCAVRRSAWEALPFDVALRYSEDADWVARLGALGWRAGYAPRAVFEHSHDYDLGASLRRRRGEGEADAAIYHLGAPSVVSDFMRPLAGSLLRDAREGRVSLRGGAARVAQAVGYFTGRAAGARRDGARGRPW